MSHPTFENAGAGPGTEIWTIENFEPVPIDPKMYGKFYNGDSYIVLKTSGSSNSSLSHDAHFWLGGRATQDKLGAAALWTVALDDALGGRAVHHREVQGHESALFLSYFKPAIRYLEGGNESGFTEVETNAGAEKRLLKLTGADNMRIEEVPAEASSLTSEHCFILEVEHDIFVLMPEGAKATQRRKIISVANGLRDDYHNGRATIEIIDDFSSDEDYDAFFAALGSGSKDDLVSEDGSEMIDIMLIASFQTYARDDVSAVYLYRVLLGDEIELVALSKPYKQRQLSSDEVYILDSPDSGVFVWLGAGLDADVKKNYYDVAQQYLALKGYPAWVIVTRVSEGAESCSFKQYFHEWESLAGGRSLLTESDAGYFSGDAEESAASARLIGKSAAARGYMPDAGDGDLVITRVCGTAEECTDRVVSTGVLRRGAAYVLRYYYLEDGRDSHVVYVWIGADASSADKASAVQLASGLEEGLAAEARVAAVWVPQGRENKHFLSLFKGTLAILYGDEENPQNAKGTYAEDGIRLFRVEGTEPGVDMRAVQCTETAQELEDDDVFVLETPDAVYIRTGKDADPSEYEAAVAFVGRVLGGREVASVEQGQEPEEFWEALGGQVDEKADPSAWKLAVNRRVTTPRTLTAACVTPRGKILFEELDTDFSQEDLSEDGVYILDGGEELYLWQGSSVPARVKAARGDIIKEYIADDGLDRTVDSALVVCVRQRAEPRAFTRLFTTWDHDMWDNLASYEDIKNETKAANSK